MDFSAHGLLLGAMYVIPLILSLTVHEFSHAWSAYLLGDDTAARQGRMTLNPLVHIDPIGTLLLPLLHVPFGWAKPVPVNPTNFRRSINMKTGMMITAAAGPASNVVLAILCAVITGLLLRFNPEWLYANPAVMQLLNIGAGMNVSLALFNMLPIPPLDGSRVVEGLLPYGLQQRWEELKTFAPLALIAVFFFGGTIIAGPARAVGAMLANIVFKLAS